MALGRRDSESVGSHQWLWYIFFANNPVINFLLVRPVITSVPSVKHDTGQTFLVTA